jgi:uncharacterized membrane protein
VIGNALYTLYCVIGVVYACETVAVTIAHRDWQGTPTMGKVGRILLTVTAMAALWLPIVAAYFAYGRSRWFRKRADAVRAWARRVTRNLD